MAAKGPNTGMGGINVKSGKSKNTNFDELMKSLVYEDDEEQDFIPETQYKPITEEQKQEAAKETQETIDFINQMIQDQNKAPSSQSQQYVQVTPPVIETPLPPVGDNTHIDIKKYNIDPTKAFNQQQPRRVTNQNRLMDEIKTQPVSEKLSLEKEEVQKEIPEPVSKPRNPRSQETYETEEQRAYRLQVEEQRRQMEMAEEDDIPEEQKRSKNNKGKSSKKTKEKTTKKSKGEKQTKEKSVKNSKETKTNKKTRASDDDKLERKGFPRTYYDPTDAETDPMTGVTDYFFNIEKTLRNNNMLWITKVIPLDFLDRLTYDKKPLDDYARKQHSRTVMLNEASAQEQYQYETRNKIIKFLIGTGVAAACVLYVIFGIIPSNNYNKAMDFYLQEDWESAKLSFTEMGDYKNAKYYGKYSEAMTKLVAKDYDAAKADFELLLPYQEYFSVSIQDAVYNCDYQKAIKTYSSGNFEEAMLIFASIAEFQESKTYYYKCGYEIADNYYESGELQLALDAFFKVKAYEDSNQRLSEIADTIYTSAMSNYNNGNYSEAIVGFQYLAKYHYKESDSMIAQCNYRAGLNEYNAGHYEEARQLFSQVLTYKDSNAMYKECTYKIAKLKYSESIESSLKEYSAIAEYRDVPTILKQGSFSIFGEWQITEMNGSKTTPVNFKFNSGGLFQTNKKVLYVAISTEATPIQYKWNGERYITADGKYSLSAQFIDENTIILTCTEPDKTVNFTCERQADYLTMLDNNILGDEENPGQTINPDDPSTNETLTQILQNYVDKKTDGTVIIKDTEYNCLLIIQEINDNLGNAKKD